MECSSPENILNFSRWEKQRIGSLTSSGSPVLPARTNNRGQTRPRPEAAGALVLRASAVESCESCQTALATGNQNCTVSAPVPGGGSGSATNAQALAGNRSHCRFPMLRAELTDPKMKSGAKMVQKWSVFPGNVSTPGCTGVAPRARCNSVPLASAVNPDATQRIVSPFVSNGCPFVVAARAHEKPRPNPASNGQKRPTRDNGHRSAVPGATHGVVALSFVRGRAPNLTGTYPFLDRFAGGVAAEGRS